MHHLVLYATERTASHIQVFVSRRDSGCGNGFAIQHSPCEFLKLENSFPA